MSTATLSTPERITLASATSKRLVSLDVFRGATIIGMIVVNNPGSWGAIYPPLRHAAWHGWTPTDLVFPFFLFIVGVAIALAYEKRLAQGVERAALVKKTASRAGMLFFLGVFMAAWPIFQLWPEGHLLRPGLDQLRIMGVLQRIAVCYLLASLLFLYATPRVRHWTLAALLLGYWAAMTLIPVPGYGAGALGTPEGTLAAWIDRLILTPAHLWVGAGRQWDPEGLLSTLPALGTTLFGVWTGRLLLSDRTALDKTVRMFAWGVFWVCVGYMWDWFFPINKGIWTSSYAVFTAGQAMCALALAYYVIDVRGKQRWTRPFVVYGVNAITVFVLSGLVAKSLNRLRVPGPEGSDPIAAKTWLFQNVFLPLGEPVFASLLYAIAWVLAWYVVLRWMYGRGLIIKV